MWINKRLEAPVARCKSHIVVYDSVSAVLSMTYVCSLVLAHANWNNNRVISVIWMFGYDFWGYTVYNVFNSGFMSDLRNSLFGRGRGRWGRGRWWWWRSAQQGTADYKQTHSEKCLEENSLTHSLSNVSLDFYLTWMHFNSQFDSVSSAIS